MTAWMLQNLTTLVSVAVAGTVLGIGLVSAFEPTTADAFVAARQLYGLTALGVLLGACLIGPLASVFTHMPLKRVLLAGRRAIGVSAFVIAIPHVACYLGPVLLHNWRDLYEPGLLWVIGLVLGLLALFDLSVLAWTSRDAAVMTMGGKRWKRLHRTVYIVTPILFLHALFVGTDFGLVTPPNGEADYGSLIAFSLLTGVWLVLAWLRHRGVRWPARSPADVAPTSDSASSSSSDS